MAIHNALVTVTTETTYRIPVEAEDQHAAHVWLDKQLNDADVTELEGCVQVSDYPQWVSDEIGFESSDPDDYCRGCGRGGLSHEVHDHRR